MTGKGTTFQAGDLRSPAVWVAAGVYIAALGLGLWAARGDTLLWMGLHAGIGFLLWFILFDTRGLEVEPPRVRQPGWELAFAGLVYLGSRYLWFPLGAFGRAWALPSIGKNLLAFFGVPLLFVVVRRYPLASVGLTLRHLRRCLRTGGWVLVFLGLPGMFLVSGTGAWLVHDRPPWVHVVAGFLVYFGRDVLLAGLPEEFFYRAFVQTRLGCLVRSETGGWVLTAVLFGLVHVPALHRWYPDLTASAVFTRAILVQGVTSLVPGLLWSRTRSLVPGVLVHSGVNALHNIPIGVAWLFPT